MNDKWLEYMPHTFIPYLSYVGSDHYPLLMEFKEAHENTIRYFKFLYGWVENLTFLDTVRGCCNKNISGNPMWIFHMKMKRLASILSMWFRNQYGDIYATIKEYEEKSELLKKR